MQAPLSLISAVTNTWVQFLKTNLPTSSSILFIDPALSESLNWNLGIEKLFNEFGFLNIQVMDKSIFNPSNGLEKAERLLGRNLTTKSSSIQSVIFFISGFLSNYSNYFSLIFPILAHKLGIRSIHICTAISAKAHAVHFSTPDQAWSSSTIFKLFTDEYLSVISSTSTSTSNSTSNSTSTTNVVIHHFPSLALTCLTEEVFLLSPSFKAFPLTSAQLKKLISTYKPLPVDQTSTLKNQLSSIDLARADKSLSSPLVKLANYLHSSLDALAIKLEIFSLGHTSQLLGQLLNTYPSPSSASRTASLLLVDRSLDLLTPLKHSENILDRILVSCPSLSTHSVDPALNIDPLVSGSSPLTRSTSSYTPTIGSLAHPDDVQSHELFSSLLYKPSKEALATLRIMLTDLIVKEELRPRNRLPKKLGALTVNELNIYLKILAESKSIFFKHYHFLSLVLAVAQALQTTAASSWNSDHTLEKVLLLSATESIDSLPKALSEHFIGVSSSKSVSLREMIKLTFLMYALQPANSFTEDDEALIMSSLHRLVLESCSGKGEQPQNIDDLSWLGLDTASELLKTAAGSADTKLSPQQLRQRIENALVSVFSKLKEAATACANAGLKRRIDVSSQEPLIVNLMKDILNPAAPELPDLQHVSYSFGSLFKSFALSSAPRPTDQQLLIVFFVGGVTALEIEQLTTLVYSQSHYPLQLIVGSNTMATSESVLFQSLVIKK